MLLNQLTLFGSLCFFVGASIFLWIKWRKIGAPLIVLIITVLFINSVGIIKFSIFGSMKFDAINLYPSSLIKNIDSGSEFISRGDAILDSLKSWNKILRGKKPIYTTSGGSQISMDSIGEEKSIKLFKRF